jgi:5-aminopentanamidase
MVMQYFGKVAVYQGGSVPGNVPQNLATVRDVTEDARRLGAHTVVFPELFLAGYDLGAEQLRATAVAVDDAPVRDACAIARAAGLNVILPFAERARGGQLYNAAAVIDREGTILTVYRKVGAVARARCRVHVG